MEEIEVTLEQENNKEEEISLISENVTVIGETYTLPIASADTLGGVKVGNNLSIDENGVLSASGGGSTQEFNFIRLTRTIDQQGVPKDSLAKIIYDKVISKKGDKLSLDDNGVLIGEGVSVVRVTAQVGYQNASSGTGQKVLDLYKNTTMVATNCVVSYSSRYSVAYPFISTIVPVEKGDHLYLYAHKDDDIVTNVLAGVYNSFIVEVIE